MIINQSEFDQAIKKLNTQLYNVRLRGYSDKEVKIDVSKIFNRGNEFKACINARQELQND
jgi:hypothetical protein